MNIDVLKKRDNFEGEIRPINLESDSKKLADFFNSIDDLWPGTWTRGVPYDEKKAKEFVEKRKALKSLVAFDPQNHIVGFCSVHKLINEPNVSYIGFLGVHPDVLGKKYGKYLLLSALDFGVKNGDQRQDLHTWPSNMKAVPLYKKIGLQWVPDTSVYMQNYLPAILQDSFCQPFFNKHPDWYLNQVRDINQAPDDLVNDKMKIFKYYFEKDGDFLEVIIDRFSRSISAIKRQINGKMLSILLKQHDHDVFAGINENFSFSITNETGSELSAVVSFEGSEEIKVKLNQESFQVPAGTKTLENSFIVADTTPDSKIYRKSPSIKSRIILDNELINLEIGMRARQIIDIFTSETNWWIPSGKQILSLHIQNRSIQPLQGELHIWSNRTINIVKSIIPIELSGEENIGTTISIDTPTINMNNDVTTTLLCQVRMKDMKSRVFEIPVFISDNPNLSTIFLTDQKQIYLQNQYIRSIIKLEGAEVQIQSPDETIMRPGLRILDFGPPFGFSEFNQIEFSQKITKTPTSIQVRLSKQSQSKPSLIFHRIFELHSGAQHLAIWEEVENLGTIDDQITTLVQPFFINGINMPIGEIYFYFDGKLVKGPNVIWPESKGDLPEGTEHFEPWKCIQTDKYSYYHIYEITNTTIDHSQSKLGTLEKMIRIPALSSSKGATSWLGCGRFDWMRVRELAYYLVKKQILTKKQKTITPISFLSVNIPKNQRLIGTKKVDIDINLISIRNMPLNGTLTICAPKEWQMNPYKFNFNNLNLDNPHKFKCSLLLSENIKLGIVNIEFVIDTKGMIKTEKIPFLVYNSDEKPRVEDLEPIEGKKQISVSNTSIEVVSSVDFAGSLTQLKHNESNYLLTNFPNLSPSIFFAKDTGGFFNLLLGRDDNLDLIHLKENYCVSNNNNAPWYGVEYSTNIHERKSLKGLIVNTAYELLGGETSFVRVRITIKNPTTALMKFITFSLLNVGIDGNTDDINSKFNIGKKTPYYFTRENPVPILGVGDRDLSYQLFEKNGKSLALLKTNTTSKIFPLDVGKNMIGSGILTYWFLEPNETEEIDYFIIADPPNEQFLNDFKILFSKH